MNGVEDAPWDPIHTGSAFVLGELASRRHSATCPVKTGRRDASAPKGWRI